MTKITPKTPFIIAGVYSYEGFLHLFIGLRRSGSEKHITFAIEAAAQI